MKRMITLHTEPEYNVIIGKNLKAFESLGDARLFILCDENVYLLYKDTLNVKNGVIYTFPAGEKSKTMDTAVKILTAMAENGFGRNDTLVAFGGGVTGDLGGFCASVYMRGIRYVQVPTTILAAVDSSVGGKTAVDFAGHKNLVGSFWQPSIVFCDTEYFKTLPARQFSAGVAEIIKYGIICDSDLFLKIESGRFELEEIIEKCVDIKCRIVEQDTRDNGIRKILNFGHTVGHAVEKLSNFNLLHGEAVSIGMCVILRGSERLGICKAGTAQRVSEVLQKYALPVSCDFCAEEILNEIKSDKKRTKNTTDMITVPEIGKAEILPLSDEKTAEIIQSGL